jgi:glucosamine-6-phosphate deaminase
MGIGNIMQSKRIVMVATGKNKAQAIRDAFCGPVTPKVPASILQLHPDFTLVADEAALSLIGDVFW